MATLTLPKNIQKILVVGPIYNKMDKLKEIEKLLPEYDWVIFNDGILYTDNHVSAIHSSLNKMDQLLATGKVVYNQGRLDLAFIICMDPSDSDQLKIAQWVKNKPNVVLADFNGSYRIAIMSGGIPPTATSGEELKNNIELSFAPHPHETYTGGLGYVITNHPLTKWAPKFYRYSVQIGNTIEGQVYALKIDRNGIQRTIII